MLRDAVRCFWHGRIEASALAPRFEILPDGYAEIIFHVGAGCAIVLDGQLRRLPSPFIIGLLGQPMSMFAGGRVDVIGIRCYPWAVFDLLGLSASREGLRLFEHPLARLQATLDGCVQAGRVEDAIAQLQAHLLASHSRVAPDRMLARAGAALREANGILAVTEVAAAAHASVRTLERKFKLSSGHTVKEVAGLMRFEQARNALFHAPQTSIAGLAQALGYADQSHLSRDFKRYTGTTPAAFAQRRHAREPGQDAIGGFVQA